MHWMIRHPGLDALIDDAVKFLGSRITPNSYLLEPIQKD